MADELHLPVNHTKDLIEVDLGLLDGHDIADPGFLSVYENMVSNWERGYPLVCIPEGESLADVKVRLERHLNAYILSCEREGPVLLVGHAILWMCFIWAFCENRPMRINDGFMRNTHLSIISKNGSGFFLEKTNLDHDEIKILKNLSA